VSTSETPFSTGTGIGSAVDDLSGSRAVAVTTSSYDTGANIAPDGRGQNGGGAEPPDVVNLIHCIASF